MDFKSHEDTEYQQRLEYYKANMHNTVSLDITWILPLMPRQITYQKIPGAVKKLSRII